MKVPMHEEDTGFVPPKGEILGIFDLDSATQAKETRAFLRAAAAAGRVRSAPLRPGFSGIPRCFVLAGSPADPQHPLPAFSLTLLYRPPDFPDFFHES